MRVESEKFYFWLWFKQDYVIILTKEMKLQMHEYSVTKNIINIVIEEADRINAGKVTEITLVIGELSSFLNESIQMYFEILSEGTILSGAKLAFKMKKAVFACKTCSARFDNPGKDYQCPECGGTITIIHDSGKEFYIESIEIE